MISRVVCLALVAIAMPLTHVAAQGGARATPDSVFARAQRLVNEGAGTQGRALIDSLFRAAPAGSAARADALYWRAQLAPDAGAAQRDFLLLTIDYALTPRAADALLGLAQLEFTRGQLAIARRYLERLVLEHAKTPAANEGWFWLGRSRLDGGDVAGGCAALDSARAALPAADIERRNQVEFAAQPCRALASTARPAPVDVSPPVTATAVTPPPPPPVSTAGPQWSVQVAAYNTKTEGERLAQRLAARGYDARVTDTQPFRVRIGHFATRAEAVALVAKLKNERTDAIVVEAERR